LKDVGFTLREIRTLLVGDGEVHACQDLPGLLERKLLKLNEQLAVLTRFKASLIEMQRACTGSCGTFGGMPSCVPARSAPGETSMCS